MPYVDKYFELLLNTWANKSYEESTTIIDGLFPMYVTSQATLDKANHWLNVTGKDGHASLRRHVAEARDSLQRALKVQAKDK
jgi:aminopeptidase N